MIETIYKLVVTIMHLQLEYVLFLSSFFFIIHQNDWKIDIFDII